MIIIAHGPMEYLAEEEEPENRKSDDAGRESPVWRVFPEIAVIVTERDAKQRVVEPHFRGGLGHGGAPGERESVGHLWRKTRIGNARTYCSLEISDWPNHIGRARACTKLAHREQPAATCKQNKQEHCCRIDTAAPGRYESTDHQHDDNGRQPEARS